MVDFCFLFELLISRNLLLYCGDFSFLNFYHLSLETLVNMFCIEYCYFYPVWPLLVQRILAEELLCYKKVYIAVVLFGEGKWRERVVVVAKIFLREESPMVSSSEGIFIRLPRYATQNFRMSDGSGYRDIFSECKNIFYPFSIKTIKHVMRNGYLS